VLLALLALLHVTFALLAFLRVTFALPSLRVTCFFNDGDLLETRIQHCMRKYACVLLVFAVCENTHACYLVYFHLTAQLGLLLLQRASLLYSVRNLQISVKCGDFAEVWSLEKQCFDRVLAHFPRL
jgi:hypothetical protein